MKDKIINKTHIEGILYEQKLEKKVTGESSKNPGTEYIKGKIDIATDDACTNIVTIDFTYVTALTAKNKVNETFTVLTNILEGKIPSITVAGKENAAYLKVDSQVGLNEFIGEDRVNGGEKLVSARINSNGFVHIADELNSDEKERNTFKTDMIITNVVHRDEDEERGIPEKAIVKGYIFDFRKNLLPIEYSVINPAAISYFEDADISSKEPMFTKVWGKQISETVIKRYEEESAFGEAEVRIVKNTRKDWVITGALREPYLWDDEAGITAEEFKQKLADRETAEAVIKQKHDEYQASKATASAIKNDAFSF